LAAVFLAGSPYAFGTNQELAIRSSTVTLARAAEVLQLMLLPRVPRIAHEHVELRNALAIVIATQAPVYGVRRGVRCRIPQLELGEGYFEHSATVFVARDGDYGELEMLEADLNDICLRLKSPEQKQAALSNIQSYKRRAAR
jgi:hypothetical protein